MIHWRRRRNLALRRSLAHRLGQGGLGLSLVISLGLVLASSVLIFLYTSLVTGLPAPEQLPLLLGPPTGSLFQPTRLYDRTGEYLVAELQNPAAAGRVYLSVDPTQPQHFPSELITATVATSDPGFWGHPGFSWQGVRRGEHPTLAQQLVVHLLLWDEPAGLRRNLRERLLAAQITQKYGRRQVLEWYLNSAAYGSLVFGADAAARTYFGKSATDLTLGEAALLAATAGAPALNPHAAPHLAHQQMIGALQAMLRQAGINADQYRQAEEQVIDLAPQLPPFDLSPDFTNLVMEQLSEFISPERAQRGGFRIITSLDYDLQLQADCAANTQLNRLAKSGSPDTPAADGNPCLAARLLPAFSSQPLVGAGMPGVNLVILDPKSGEILALVGDAARGLDPAHLPGHAPGTLLTPFVYLTGFTRGLSPASLIWDIPGKLPQQLEDISQLAEAFHGPLRLRSALANDYLGSAVQVLAQVGPENAWRTARQAGLTTLEAVSGPQAYRLMLDEGEVLLLEAVQAYGVFANQGLLVGMRPVAGKNTTSLSPVALRQVVDDAGKIWLECGEGQPLCQIGKTPVISTQLAYLVNHVLSDEPARWPSLGHPNSLEIGRPAGAKVGRTTTQKDAWTVGYTPQLAVGVWFGSATNSGGPAFTQAAAGLWHALIQYASRALPTSGWQQPAGISTVEVCDPSGMLPTRDCPVVVQEIFLSGREPTFPDTLFQAVEVNRESGNLATIFTPPGLVDRRVYLVAPPEAAAWAQAADLPLIPESYDVLSAPEAPKTNAQITAPEMFASLSGQVDITGRAGGAGFSHYRVQVGQGLNPQEWLQLGDDIAKPVWNGVLARWDTRALAGIYAVQLLVVRGQQKVDTHTIQVTIDNNPPKVRILYPVAGQQMPLPAGNTITLQAEASDDLDLERLIFSIDDQPLVTLTLPPFAAAWQARIGKHILRVRALDRAGNQQEAEVSFEIIK